MENQRLQADTAFGVHLRSYGFFHSGRERLQTRVLKRVWEHIPGGTLYGAVAAALIRLEGLDDTPPGTGTSDYHALLRAVQEQRIRFTPLLPTAQDTCLDSAQAYCEQALRLHAALYADAEAVTSEHEQHLLHTTPHAPQNRHHEQIHEDQLFVLRTHRPCLDYYGFIFATAQEAALLHRAFRLFPFMPLGGRGKFSLVEATLLDGQPLSDFKQTLTTWAAGRSWARLLTPQVLQDAALEPAGDGREWVTPGLRRYRVWRTGWYYDAAPGKESPFTAWGAARGEEQAPDGFLAGGQESDAVLALPERSRFSLKAGDDLATWFTEGLGNPGWTYLGWGQVVLE